MAGRLTHKWKANAGLTLIELLVVMAIIALVASFVAINAPPPQNNARTEADRFALSLQTAASDAIMTGQVIGLEITTPEYKFYTYNRGEWSPIASGPLRPGAFDDDVAVAVEAIGELQNDPEPTLTRADRDAPAPTFFFSPTGEATPLMARFQNDRRFWTLTLENDGDIKVVRDDAS